MTDTIPDEPKVDESKSYLSKLCHFKMDNNPLSMIEHFPMEIFFKFGMPRRLVVMCGRQVGKSVSIALQGILQAATTPSLHTLFIQPRFEQIKRFSRNYVGRLIADSDYKDTLYDPDRENSILQRSLPNGSNLHFTYAFLDADRSRGLSVMKCAFDEVQDINY